MGSEVEGMGDEEPGVRVSLEGVTLLKGMTLLEEVTLLEGVT